MPKNPSHSPSHDRASDPPAGVPPRLDSTALFGTSRELIIVHNGREYRLRMTQNEKLILTA